MPTIDLPNGTVNYRVAGPEDSAAPPVVFVHGFLVDGTLWSRHRRRAGRARHPLLRSRLAAGVPPVSR